jgi:NAD(P)-dependent dehydrogenase (short-subunit alcohol dehydrogenase family)
MAGEHQGRVAVITGGARGFGKAFGVALAERGAQVVLMDIDAAAAEAAAAELRGADLKASALTCNVADDAQTSAAMASVAEEHGGIDILINNAGLHSDAYSKPMGELGMAGLRRLFDVNVMGVMGCALAARPAMAGRRNASIINISSSAGYGPDRAFGVSKLAVRGLTVAFAREFAEDGIRVNAVAPGLVGTDTIRKELSEDIVKAVMRQQLIPRWGEETDIVEGMLFLVSDKASFMTGETLRISGGFALSV